MSHPIRTLLIDDHRFIHQTIELLLRNVPDIELIAQGGNGREAIQLCEEQRPDLLLMDVVMPFMDGVEATRIIRRQFPDIKILVLSSYQDHKSVKTMLQNGAIGYLIKGALTSELIPTIRTAYQGNIVLSQEVINQLLYTNQAQNNNDFSLTDRELEVLAELAHGDTMREIASTLKISTSTVKFHINNIQNKLGAQSRTQAIIVAAKNNLI